MMLFLLLTITAAFTTYTRRLIFYIVLAYGFYNGDLLGEIPFFSGALLADLSLYLNSADAATAPSWSNKFPKFIRDYWAIAMAIFGLTIGSYPAFVPENSWWSRRLTDVGVALFHPNCNSSFPSLHSPFLITSSFISCDRFSYHFAGEIRWAYTFFGAYVLLFAIHFSPGLRRVFSHPIALFYGSISFPLYLIHSFLMRSVLVWVMFGVLPPSHEGTGWYIWCLMRLTAFLSWFAMITYLSILWRDRIDKISMHAAQWSEEYMLGKKSLSELIHSLAGTVGRLSLKVESLTNGNGYDEKRSMTKDAHPV
jgi:peptidoglycan/LPS O-acetylase OafA/YrhL